MACKCQKPCEKDICCSVCNEVETCKDRCKTCAPEKQAEKEEPKPKEEE